MKKCSYKLLTGEPGLWRHQCINCGHQTTSTFEDSSKIHRNCKGGAVLEPDPLQPPGRKYLGDHIHDALSAVGITEERVGKWLGKPCKCPGRRERVNQIHRWVERKTRGLFGSKEEARKDLEDILDQ